MLNFLGIWGMTNMCQNEFILFLLRGIYVVGVYFLFEQEMKKWLIELMLIISMSYNIGVEKLLIQKISENWKH